jgi:hypothetical protein
MCTQNIRNILPALQPFWEGYGVMERVKSIRFIAGFLGFNYSQSVKWQLKVHWL